MKRDEVIRDGHADGKADALARLAPKQWDTPPATGLANVYRMAYREAYRAYATRAGLDMLDGG